MIKKLLGDRNAKTTEETEQFQRNQVILYVARKIARKDLKEALRGPKTLPTTSSNDESGWPWDGTLEMKLASLGLKPQKRTHRHRAVINFDQIDHNAFLAMKTDLGVDFSTFARKAVHDLVKSLTEMPREMRMNAFSRANGGAQDSGLGIPRPRPERKPPLTRRFRPLTHPPGDLA